MSVVQGLLTIGEVSSRTGLSVDTLRFYEREGLIPPPQRSAGGRRGFSDNDLAWIGICQRLRAAGMPLPEIARYAEMVRAGTGNETDRLELLRAHEVKVRAQMAVLQDALDLISTKVTAYTQALTQGIAGGLFISDADDDAYFATQAEDSSDRPASTS